MVHATADEVSTTPGPAKIWSVKDPPYEGFRQIDKQGYAQTGPETAIVVDNGMLAPLHSRILKTKWPNAVRRCASFKALFAPLSHDRRMTSALLILQRICQKLTECWGFTRLIHRSRRLAL